MRSSCPPTKSQQKITKFQRLTGGDRVNATKKGAWRKTRQWQGDSKRSYLKNSQDWKKLGELHLSSGRYLAHTALLSVVMTAHPLPPTPGVTSRVTLVMKNLSIWVASQFLYHLIRKSDFSMDKVNM